MRALLARLDPLCASDLFATQHRSSNRPSQGMYVPTFWYTIHSTRIASCPCLLKNPKIYSLSIVHTLDTLGNGAFLMRPCCEPSKPATSMPFMKPCTAANHTSPYQLPLHNLQASVKYCQLKGSEGRERNRYQKQIQAFFIQPSIHVLSAARHLRLLCFSISS